MQYKCKTFVDKDLKHSHLTNEAALQKSMRNSFRPIEFSSVSSCESQLHLKDDEGGTSPNKNTRLLRSNILRFIEDPRMSEQNHLQSITGDTRRAALPQNSISWIYPKEVSVVGERIGKQDISPISAVSDSRGKDDGAIRIRCENSSSY